MKISVDAHGRAYLTYQSNANPTILNTQCLGANIWFYFFIRGIIFIIIYPLLGSEFSVEMFLGILRNLYRSTPDPNGVRQQNDGFGTKLCANPIAQAILKTAP